MRKGSLVGVCAAVVVAQGCALKLPGNLQDPSLWFPKPVVATNASPKPDPGSEGAGCLAKFKGLDKDGDAALSLDEWLKDKGGKGANDRNARAFLDLDEDQDRQLSLDEYARACGETTVTVRPRPATPAPATPPPPSRPRCEGSFEQFDGDGDGLWSLDEFMAWEATRPRKARPCAEGVVIAAGAGNLVAAGGGNIVAAGGGAMIVANRRQLMQLNAGATIAFSGGAFISNQGGGLIGNSGAGLIANNGRYVPDPCPPDDPKYRYGQFDHDGDGMVSAEEFCAGPGARPMPIGSHPPEPFPFPSPLVSPEPYPATCEDGFFASDADGDGLVTREEYANQRQEGPQLVYQNNGAWVTPLQADDFAAKDLDGDGYLSLDESCYGGPEPEPSDDPTEWCSFYKLDDDGDDQVTWEEYLEWSGRNTFPAPPKEVAYAEFSGYDFDQNFVLTSDEWCGEIAAPTPPPFPWPRTSAPPTPPPPPVGDAQLTCLQAFHGATVGNGNSVSFEAYAQARVDQTRWVQKPTDAELKAQRQMWIDQAKSYDRDRDGRLSVTEVQAFCSAGIPLGYRK